MDTLTLNRAIGELFGYRVAQHNYLGRSAYIIERNGHKEPFSDCWLIEEQLAWAEYSPNWAFEEHGAVQLIAGNPRFCIQVVAGGFRVTVADTPIVVEQAAFAHAVSEAWYTFVKSEGL
jgi:hypothetical protein